MSDNKKELFDIYSDVSDEFPPRGPFTAALVEWTVENQDNNFNPDKPKVDAQFIYRLQPLDEESARMVGEDGLIFRRLKMSSSGIAAKTGKPYRILTPMWERFRADAKKATGKDFSDPDAIVGVPMSWAEVDKKSFGDYPPRRHPTMLAGKVADGFVPPSNLNALVEEGKAKSAERRANREAGAGAAEAQEVELVATKAPAALDLGDFKATILDALDGVSKANIFAAIAGNESLKTVPEALVKELYKGNVQAALIADGSLNLTDGVYKKA